LIGTIIECPVASIPLQAEETLPLTVGARLTLCEQNDLLGDVAAAVMLSARCRTGKMTSSCARDTPRS